MAQLSSPGVSVTVVDESFYNPSAPGTVPLIVVATQANKMNSAGTGVAPGTLAANAGNLYLLTSQADLGSTFGIPYFQTDAANNPVNAGEVNEYGLQAAYSFLGVSNQAYVVRADIDLAQLEGSATAPIGSPIDGTYWWNTSTTSFGVFEWNSNPATQTDGQTFANQTVPVITSSALTTGSPNYAPLTSYGAVGSYAVVAATTLATLWYKQPNTASDGTAGSTSAASTAGTWVQVGSTAWVESQPTAVGNIQAPTLLSGDTLVVNGYTITGVTTLGGVATAITAHTSLTASVQNGYLNIYSSGADVVITGSAFVKIFNYTDSAGNQRTTGTFKALSLQISPHYNVPNFGSYQNPSSVYGYPSGSVWIKTTPVNLGANWDIEKYSENSGAWLRQSIPQLYPNNQSAMAALDATGGGINIPVGSVYVKYNDDEATPAYAQFKIYQRTSTGSTTATTSIIGSSTLTSGSNTFTITSSQVGSSSLPSAVTVTFTAAGNAGDAAVLAAAINNQTSGLGNISATVTGSNQVSISHIQGGDIRLVDGTNTPLAKLLTVGTTTNFYTDPTGNANSYIITAWAATNSSGTALVIPSPTAPTSNPANGTLWYDSSVSDVDILINTGSAWVGYLTSGATTINQAVGGSTTDPMGPIVSATQPTLQSGGLPLANGDLWINSSNLQSWPEIYRFNYLTKSWTLINNEDHTTQNGIVFADARWNVQPTTGTNTGTGDPSPIATLLHSTFVDFDAPNPQLYPKGTLLYNLRRSGFNVKKYHQGYVNTLGYNTAYTGEQMTHYYPDRWVSDAPNDYNNVGVFGTHAQRAVVVAALDATINSNQHIRNEDSVVFNLLSCPGYLETLPSLVELNTDRGLLSFIVADAPAHLTPDATSLSNWGSNANNAPTDGPQGLVTTDANTAVYYPWGYTTDLHGNNIVVPPSHIMLTTIALNDSVAYPWFAPAGVRRGGVRNASSVGYVDAQTGEFVTVALNTGQRDTLAKVHVNPITYIGGVGLVAYAQYTRQLVASSLDRINVARLVIYLRYQLNAIAIPYVFEPNDTITRNQIAGQIGQLMLNLTAERALYDYVVVCDTSNNTPSRIDANELYVDIAIEPVKAIEFIYIPLRLENTGAISKGVVV